MSNNFKITRLGRKLTTYNDPRTIQALPKDVSERCWNEILQKEEAELAVLDLREELFEEAMRIGYENYMEKQTTFFTVHCAALAWLKILDWHFYRPDPGEDPSAFPPCYIPKRDESWVADEPPEPSIKDNWARHSLQVVEPCPEEPLPESPKVDSVILQTVESIPEKYWFPGKVNLTTDYIDKYGVRKRHVMNEDPMRQRPDVELRGENGKFIFVETSDPSIFSGSSLSPMEPAESEVLQRVTDYPCEETEQTPMESRQSSPKPVTPAEGSLRGAGDSAVGSRRNSLRPIEERTSSRNRRSSRYGRLKSSSRQSMQRSRLPPLAADSLSPVSVISDCRLRNLRLDTHYSLSSEKVDSVTEAGRQKKK